MKQSGGPRSRLDVELVRRKLVATRSQAESYIKLGRVRVNARRQDKASWQVKNKDKIEVSGQQYVSRAALKLESVAQKLNLDFKDKLVLDVGSSTGGFTDYALQHGARKVIAVDVGTDQLHPKLRGDERVELHEKTDIRDFRPGDWRLASGERPDIVLVDVSFVSVRQILPSVSKLLSPNSQLLVMVKPQFEVGDQLKHKGVIKNDRLRRQILKDFEAWAKSSFVILDKADAKVAGAKGNRERFYKLGTRR